MSGRDSTASQESVMGAAPPPTERRSQLSRADSERSSQRFYGRRHAYGELRWIGLLDAFGFERLESNSFEQLLINTTNEQLQHFFLHAVMKAEQELYEQEGIAWQPVAFHNNAATIELLQKRPSGVLPALDEECRLPKGSDAALAKKVGELLAAAGHEQRKGRRECTRARLREVNRARTPYFVVTHFAGEVVYEVVDWLEKNNDTLHDDLRGLVGRGHPLLARLFDVDTRGPPTLVAQQSSHESSGDGKKASSTCAARPRARAHARAHAQFLYPAHGHGVGGPSSPRGHFRRGLFA